MNIFFTIISLLFSGALLVFLINKVVPKIAGVVAFITIAVVSALFFTQVTIGETYPFTMGEIQMQFGVTHYTYIFAIIVLGLSTLASLYSIQYMEGKERLGFFYSNYLLTVAGMIGIIFSQDFISFFIFWEIMTWSSYLLVIYDGYNTRKVGMKYMIFSAIGAYAMLAAIVSIKANYDTYIITEAMQKGAFSFADHMYIPIMLLIGFAVKAALMPLHVWAPKAYSKSPMSFTVLFSGAMSKMGILGMGLVLASAYSYANTESANAITALRYALGWLGGITAVMGTIYALIQTDAKKLLAYSSVAQLGYIIVGLSTGTKLGVMAALFLAIVHGVFKGALFMVVGAVEKQAGTTDMTKISGLIRRMPWTFFVALVSIIALAGVPPLGGFVGKWMLYEALITESNNYFLVIVIFFSSTAAFLYSYRFLYGLFLGQEEKDTEHVKEAPITMLIPMVILAVILIITGTFPGVLFEPIAHGMHYLGFNDVNWDMSILVNVWGLESNMGHISMSIGVVFVVIFAFLTIKGYKGTKNVGTKDISTGGEIPTENENLSYQLDYFKPFERAAAPLYKRSMNKIWNDLANAIDAVFDFTRKIYTGNGQTYAIFVVVFLVILLLFKDTLFAN